MLVIIYEIQDLKIHWTLLIPCLLALKAMEVVWIRVRWAKPLVQGSR